VKSNFLHRFSNFNFRKKKEKREFQKNRRENKRKSQFVINYHTPFHEPNNSNIVYSFVRDREKRN